MPKIDKSLPLMPGNDFYMRQDEQSNLLVYALQGGKVKKFLADTHTGTWDPLDFTQEEFNLLDKDIKAIEGDFIEDFEVLLLQKANEMRAIQMPGDENVYSHKTPFRLYWAYDTKKLYINMADQWVFCGTLMHDLMEGAGKYSHEVIDNFIDAGGDASINGLSGNVTLVAGNNVTIDTDSVTKAITINTATGATGAKGEPGDIGLIGPKGDIGLTYLVNTLEARVIELEQQLLALTRQVNGTV